MAITIRVTAAKRRANSMCNSYAKYRVLFVACSPRKIISEPVSWIEKPSVGGKLPTSDLGLSHLEAHIHATEVNSTGKISHGALPTFADTVECTRRENGRLPRADNHLWGEGVSPFPANAQICAHRPIVTCRAKGAGGSGAALRTQSNEKSRLTYAGFAASRFVRKELLLEDGGAASR